ncbi:MAG: acyl CoA:acetate/3-ketoacid CoA transferase [Saezia sp.]
MKKAIISASEAAQLINDGDHLVVGGFIGAVVPEALHKALEQRFLKTQSPRNLSLYFTAGQGDGKEKANNHLAHEGLVKSVIGGHWGLIPKLQKLANENKITGYNFPQGVLAHLMRDSAAGKPGTLSHVGLGTFVDPRLEGGKINSVTKEDKVSLMTVKGKEYLFFDRLDVNAAFIRGTTADEKGNITMEEECLFLENLAIAQLVKNCGGKVIVQVKRVVPSGTLDPQQVRIPGIFVDYLVVSDDETDHMQTFAEPFNPAYCTNKADKFSGASKSFPMDVKKVIARRAALELKKNAVVNYGIGIPEFIAKVTDEEGVTGQLNATVEPGAIGGTPASGLSFGASSYPDAIITQDQMFDFYDGGGIDQAFLGLAECDEKGNLNVSKFGVKIAGCGGFIDITQNAKEVFFCGTFTAGGSEINIAEGRINIVKDGGVNKFIKRVQQVTFAGDIARENKKPVLYITERAVFKLSETGGIELIEIAPGVNLEKDILAKMDFVPKVSPNLTEMDARIFSESVMKLALRDKK